MLSAGGTWLVSPTMRKRVRIETEAFHGLSRTLVILLSCGIRQQEFRPAFGRVSLHGHHNSGADENSVVTWLRCDGSTFLNAVAFPQFGGNVDCATFAYFYGIHELRKSDRLIFRRNSGKKHLSIRTSNC